MSKRMKIFNIATPIIAGSLIVGTALWAITQAVLVKASDIAVPEAQKEATVATTDGSTEIQLQWNGDRPDNNKLFGIAIYNENVEGESTSLLTVWNSRDVVINDDGTVDVVVAFKDDVVLHQTTTVNYSLRLTYLVNGQEVTKTIDNFKLTYEVANVNVSVGGIPGVRIVRLTPVNPAVGQTLSVVVESKQYPITGIKSITTGPSQEIVPDNMYVISHDTTGYRALIRIHGTWVKGDIVITLSNALKARVVSPDNALELRSSVDPEMDKSFICSVDVPNDYPYEFIGIKCKGQFLSPSSYKSMWMRGPSYVTITFNINPGVIKGDLLFIFSSEPLIQIVTNPKISSDNYWIDYTDALLAMDSEVYIGFDESISESVSFDGLECDGSFLTPGTDFDWNWDENYAYFNISGKVLTGNLTFYFDVESPQPPTPVIAPGLENYMIVEGIEDSTISIERKNECPLPNVSYSYDGQKWAAWSGGAPLPIGKGQTFYVRGTNKTWSQSESVYARFVFSSGSRVAIKGNVMGLIDGGTNTDVIPNSYCFAHLFDADNAENFAVQSVSTTFLPAMTLTEGCYDQMFYNCDGLTTSIPELPAKVLKNKCYYRMFYSCEHMAYANISANEYSSAEKACEEMFVRDGDLSYIGIATLGDFGEDNFKNWVSYVGSNGAFVYSGLSTTRGVDSIPQNWNIWKNQESQCFTIKALEPTTVYLRNNDGIDNIDLESSLNGGVWTPVPAISGSEITVAELGEGDTLQLKGPNSNGLAPGREYNQLTFEGKVDLSGNIMSLLDNGTFTMTEVPSYGFFALISATNIEGRTSSVNSMRNLVLPARTVKSCGYSCMFASNEACINGPRIGVRYVEYEAFDSTFFCNYSLNNVYIEYPGAFDVKSEGEFYQWLLLVNSTDGTLYYDGFDRSTSIPDNWTVKPLYYWWVGETK